MTTTTTTCVYTATENERAYQRTLNWEHADTPDVFGETLIVRHLINVLLSEWTTTEGNYAALCIVRKILGVSARALKDKVPVLQFQGCDDESLTFTQLLYNLVHIVTNSGFYPHASGFEQIWLACSKLARFGIPLRPQGAGGPGV